MGTKMVPSYAILFIGYIERQHFNQYNGPKPELCHRYIDDCIGATSSTKLLSIRFILLLNIPGKLIGFFFIISGYQSFYQRYGLCTSVHASNPLILIATYCIHLHIDHMSRIPVLILSFLE